MRRQQICFQNKSAFVLSQSDPAPNTSCLARVSNMLLDKKQTKKNMVTFPLMLLCFCLCPAMPFVNNCLMALDNLNPAGNQFHSQIF